MIFTAPYSFINAGNLVLHLHADHLADLRASGLTDDTISAAGVYSISPHDIARFFNLRRGVPAEIKTALCFPYQGAKFARIKLFPSILDWRGKQMKYSQPAGTGARIYMPFPISTKPIIVTEGEKKTLSAYQTGFNAVGVGGIWNWIVKDTGEPIADLEVIDWTDREATLIPDSDVFARPNLLRAIYALGRELRALGANVLVAQIPQSGSAKVGLDDFLVAGGDVQKLEVFSLSHRIFKSCEFWHSRWKFQKALRAAA